MKRVVIGIFAHPDDESFGPGGTIAAWVRDGSDVHTITLTAGEAGTNTDNLHNLGSTRQSELASAGHVLGLSSSVCLGFPDSGICHQLYPDIGKALESQVLSVLSDYGTDTEVSLMTFEDHGISGHLDHIAASFLATRLFAQLKQQKRACDIWYYCLSEAQMPNQDWSDYFTARGRNETYITDSVDVRDSLATKFTAMDAHQSQRTDAESIKKLGNDMLATENFHVVRATVDPES